MIISKLFAYLYHTTSTHVWLNLSLSWFISVYVHIFLYSTIKCGCTGHVLFLPHIQTHVHALRFERLCDSYEEVNIQSEKVFEKNH